MTAEDASSPAGKLPEGHVPWRNPRFGPAVDRVRKTCGLPEHDREDDAMIGMLLDRFKFDHDKVVEMYRKSQTRRMELGMREIKENIVSNNLQLDDFPHHVDVGRVVPIFASTSMELTRPPPAAAAAEPAAAAAASAAEHTGLSQEGLEPVIGCYEMRYGQGDNSRCDSAAVTPDQFTKYMLYVTQWRWLQCEAYARRHGELGFWSMIHDLSCPQGFFSLWGKTRHLLSKYMNPVEEACSGLFPPMVQKILIINVPRMFSPIWSVISLLLPEQHKERIVLLSTNKTTPDELSKYMPPEHLPPHVKQEGGG